MYICLVRGVSFSCSSVFCPTGTHGGVIKRLIFVFLWLSLLICQFILQYSLFVPMLQKTKHKKKIKSKRKLSQNSEIFEFRVRLVPRALAIYDGKKSDSLLFTLFLFLFYFSTILKEKIIFKFSKLGGFMIYTQPLHVRKLGLKE